MAAGPVLTADGPRRRPRAPRARARRRPRAAPRRGRRRARPERRRQVVAAGDARRAARAGGGPRARARAASPPRYRRRRWPAARVRANVEAALGVVGRAPRASGGRARGRAAPPCASTTSPDRRADTLSGGEARRVHLARAVALHADALLLDEPFAGLDAPTRAELLRDAAAALRDPERATLVVLHDRAEAWALADRLLVLLDGRVAAQGTPRQVLERPPSPAVARFLGFTGTIREPAGVRCVRPAHVALDAAGTVRGHGRGAHPGGGRRALRGRARRRRACSSARRTPGRRRARTCGCGSTAAWCSPDGVRLRA